MTRLVNQITPAGMHVPGLPERDYPPTIAGTAPISVATTPSQVTISVTTGAYLNGGRQTAPFTAAVNTQYEVCSGCTFNLPSSAAQGDKIKLSLFVPLALYGINPNGLKINNSTSTLFVNGGDTFEITYDATLGDWE
jgi:hypothetical protein